MAYIKDLKTLAQSFSTSDIWAGLAGSLVAVPSAIAFGILIFPNWQSGALYGILGSTLLGLITPFLSGADRLVTAPCAPAAAILSAFTLNLEQQGVPFEVQLFMVLMTTVLTGAFQFILGIAKGGTLIKYIPYPVVAGYLSGVGVIILTGQLPKFLGLTGKISWYQAPFQIAESNPIAIVVGVSTIITMIFSPIFIKKIPSAVIAITSGFLVYIGIAFFKAPELLSIENNPLVVGPITSGQISNIFLMLNKVTFLKWEYLQQILITSSMLAILLSIDTLKTCLVLDALTRGRHDSNQELKSQGVGNIFSGLLGAMPGAGTMGATLVTLTSGAKSQFAPIFVGIFSFIVLFALSFALSWLPMAALSGVLIVVGFRMIDKHIFILLNSRRTIFDFFVIATVVVTAVAFNLIAAAAVGILLSAIFFIKEQVKSSVVRRRIEGFDISSTKKRNRDEIKILSDHKKDLVVFELQGNLFFGTTDQLMSLIDSEISKRKYILLDLRRITSMDYSAAHLFEQIAHKASERKITLIICEIPEAANKDVWHYLKDVGLGQEKKYLKFFKHFDDALIFIENSLLGQFQYDHESIESPMEINLFDGVSESSLLKLKNKMTQKELQTHQVLFKQGDIGDELYIITKGTIRIGLQRTEGKFHYLASFSPGDFLGDMAFLDKGKRTADAIASEETEVWILTRKDFDDALNEHPVDASTIFENLSKLLSFRLRQADLEIRSLTET